MKSISNCCRVKLIIIHSLLSFRVALCVNAVVFTFLQLGLDADEVSFYTEPLCWTSCRNGRIVNF